MQPVTIKSNQRFDLRWFSNSLLIMVVVAILLSSIRWQIALLASFIIAMLFFNNLKLIQKNKTITVVMDVESDFKFVQGQQVSEAQLISYWLFPNVMMMRLKSTNKHLYLLLFRSIIKPSLFSRLLVGIKKNDNREF